MIAFQFLTPALATLSLAGPQVTDVHIQIVDSRGLPVEGTDLFVSDSHGATILAEVDAASRVTTQAWGEGVTLVLPEIGKVLEVPLTGADGTEITLRVGGVKNAAAVTSVKPFSHPQPVALGVGAPPNDDCADAIPIFDGDTAFSTVGATTDGTVGSNQDEIWFTYTATCTGVASFSTCNQANFDTDLLLLTGDDCAAQSALAIVDDTGGCGLTTTLSAGVVEGQTYLLSVGGFGVGDQGTGTLTVGCVASAANDSCDGAEAVAVGGEVTFDNSANTNDPSDPDFSCIFNGPGPGFGSTWFSFVAEETSAELDTSLSQGSDDTVVAVYSGDCDNLVEIGCGEDIDLDGGNFLTNLVVTDLTPGEEYLVQVSTFSEASAGEITLTIDNGPTLEVFNGSGVNTATLTSDDLLVSGQPFSATASPAGLSRIGFSLGEGLAVLPFGEFLLDPNLIGSAFSLTGEYSLAVPANVNLIGMTIYMQAIAGDGTLTNGLTGEIME